MLFGVYVCVLIDYFSQKGTIKALKQQEAEIPLIDRKKEREEFQVELQKVKSQADSQMQLIVLTGVGGVGKSRLLDSLIVLAVKHGVR